MTCRFGFTLPNNFGVEDIGAVVDLAVEAEQLGYDSVWVNHHVLNIGYVADRLGDQPYHDALTVLTAAAVKTERVGLGTSVLVLPYLHPMVLAKSLATIDQLSGGRVIAGLGVGSLEAENLAMGVEWDRRGLYSDEAIAVMQALWASGPASFEGEFFSMTDVVASPKPHQSTMPVYIGGNRKPALRRVARFAQGWHPLGVRPDGITRRLATIRELADEWGRDVSELEVSVRLDTSALETPDLIEGYLAAGVTELVWSVNSGDVDEIRAAMTATIGHRP